MFGKGFRSIVVILERALRADETWELNNAHAIVYRNQEEALIIDAATSTFDRESERAVK